tara:strand:+ start:118 stop:1491 length:1374 start_codon:yes stop_codon:yes gene_type:complete
MSAVEPRAGQAALAAPAPAATTAGSALAIYYAGLYVELVRGGGYRELRQCTPSTRAALQIHWLALSFKLWHSPHYRSGTFQKDMIKNLRNVAVPVTGVPLSLLCYSRLIAAFFLVAIYPLLCAVGALVKHRMDGVPLGKALAMQLLEPEDWFAFWRLNCVLASYHALVAGEEGYEMEDKLTFLEACDAAGIPSSPWLKMPKLICKHRNEEGGLGYAVFSNATAGGDWIIQHSLDNAPEIARLLPQQSPLSTLRLVTASRAALKAAPKEQVAPSDISVLSACWRAGRAGAVTDHSSILFDVDLETGQLKRGTSNAHWYQRGLWKALQCPWRSPGHTESVHPDTGVRIEGERLPEIGAIRQLVLDAHQRICPAVPLVGWDVALTTQGMCLLEGNLSCKCGRARFCTPARASPRNPTADPASHAHESSHHSFFRASFDKAAYFSFVEDVVVHLERIERAK